MKKDSGIIKWFDIERGYGFVRRSDGKELFIHSSDIDTPGYCHLHEGQRIGFQTVKRGKGLEAKHVDVY